MEERHQGEPDREWETDKAASLGAVLLDYDSPDDQALNLRSACDRGEERTTKIDQNDEKRDLLEP